MEDKDFLEQAMNKVSKIFEEDERSRNEKCILEDVGEENNQVGEKFDTNPEFSRIISSDEHEDTLDNISAEESEISETTYSYIQDTVSMTDAERKTVLITGGARRIGRELVLAFAKSGWNVIIHCNRSLEEARMLAKEITKYGGHPAVLRADLSDEEKVRQIFPQIAVKYRKVDCLINNAAVFERDEFKEISAESWNKHMLVNVKAPLILMQDFAKQYYSDNGEAGNIINITDAKVFAPTASFFSYQISKSALSDITRAAAIALAPDIRVNAIAPGIVLPSDYMNVKQLEEKEKDLPLRRKTSVKEICQAVEFLLNSPSTTGETIVLSSGTTL